MAKKAKRKTKKQAKARKTEKAKARKTAKTKQKRAKKKAAAKRKKAPAKKRARRKAAPKRAPATAPARAAAPAPAGAAPGGPIEVPRTNVGAPTTTLRYRPSRPPGTLNEIVSRSDWPLRYVTTSAVTTLSIQRRPSAHSARTSTILACAMIAEPLTISVNSAGTSTVALAIEVTDAEVDLLRARLEAINARVDHRLAEARLRHALGRDAGET